MYVMRTREKKSHNKVIKLACLHLPRIRIRIRIRAREIILRTDPLQIAILCVKFQFTDADSSCLGRARE